MKDYNFLNDNYIVKKKYIFSNLKISTKSAMGTYYSGDYDISLEGYEVIAVVIENWQESTSAFNIIVPTDSTFRLFSNSATTIKTLWLNVTYRKISN